MLGRVASSDDGGGAHISSRPRVKATYLNWISLGWMSWCTRTTSASRPLNEWMVYMWHCASSYEVVLAETS